MPIFGTPSLSSSYSLSVAAQLLECCYAVLAKSCIATFAKLFLGPQKFAILHRSGAMLQLSLLNCCNAVSK